MKILLNSRLFIKDQFDTEKELQTVVQLKTENIFNEDVLYIPQTYIQTAGGIGTRDVRFLKD
jgi:hypothetical protein